MGSTIYMELQCENGKTNPITSILVGFRCECGWFSINKEATANGYSLIEFSDKPDAAYSGVFGGLQAKLKKGANQLFYHKYHSRLYSEFTLEQVRKKINIVPVSALDYFAKAKLNLKINDLMEAMGNLNKSIELNPKLSEAYLLRGMINYDNVGENKTFEKGSNTWLAMENYNKSIELNPKLEAAYLNRGILKSFIEDYLGAIKDYTKVVELNSKSEEAYISRGNVKDKMRDYPGAIDDYNNALEINPINAETFSLRAIEKFNSKDKKGACSDMAKAKELGLKLSGRLDLIELLQKCP